MCRYVLVSPGDVLKEQAGSALLRGATGDSPLKEEVPLYVHQGAFWFCEPYSCKMLKYQLAGCFQSLCSLCVRVGVHTKLETSCSGVLTSFFLPRQQALFHVLSAYSVYNTVSSKLVQLK